MTVYDQDEPTVIDGLGRKRFQPRPQPEVEPDDPHHGPIDSDEDLRFLRDDDPRLSRHERREQRREKRQDERDDD
jgi:hypothetical protein